MRICGGCGAIIKIEGRPCTLCGSHECIEYSTPQERAADESSLEDIEVRGEKGRVIGQAVANVVAPGNAGVSVMLGMAGRFIGRRLAKGYDLISFGDRPVKKAKKPRAKKTTQNRSKTKEISKRRPRNKKT